MEWNRWSGPRRAKFPDVEHGYEFECHVCGEDHRLDRAILLTSARRAPEILVYICRGEFKIGAVNGKLVADRAPDRRIRKKH